MSIQINLPDDKELSVVQAHFLDQDSVRQTMTDLRDATPGIPFSRLWRFASG